MVVVGGGGGGEARRGNKCGRGLGGWGWGGGETIGCHGVSYMPISNPPTAA